MRPSSREAASPRAAGAGSAAELGHLGGGFDHAITLSFDGALAGQTGARAVLAPVAASG